MVRVLMRNREVAVRSGMTVRDTMLKLDLDPEAWLAVRNGRLINEAMLTVSGDTIKLVPVISGG